MAGESDAGGSEARGAVSVVSVLLVVSRNRELRGVELAYATFNIGEWATWLAMLVYAYAHGGVTKPGWSPR